jgi:hypothetical protein
MWRDKTPSRCKHIPCNRTKHVGDTVAQEQTDIFGNELDATRLRV